MSEPAGSQEVHLQRVRALIAGRDFDGAVKVCQNALMRPSRSATAEAALFDLALVYSHYANPKKDYRKSLDSFSRLLREYPRSTYAEEAKIWVDLLETLEQTKQVDIELEEKKRGLAW